MQDLLAQGVAAGWLPQGGACTADGNLTGLVARRPWVSLRKVGGLWHWRIGRLGGSFYWATPRS